MLKFSRLLAISLGLLIAPAALAESAIPEVKIASEAVFEIGSLGITNGMLGMFLVSLILIIVGFYVRAKANIVPTRLQVALEGVFLFFLDGLTSAFGSEKEARRFFPLIATMFLVFFVANQFGILPIINQLVLEGGDLSLFRVPTADFSLPIAMALLVVGLANIMALMISPLKHLDGYLKLSALFKIRSIKDVPNALLELFLSILDIIGEIAKVVSLSARLFGNVFAGELMVIIITYVGATFTNFIVPIPFIFLSIFSGLIHAFVFPLLSVQYLAGSINAVKQPTEAAEVKA